MGNVGGRKGHANRAKAVNGLPGPSYASSGPALRRARSFLANGRLPRLRGPVAEQPGQRLRGPPHCG